MSANENAQLARSLFEHFNNRRFDLMMAAASDQVEVTNVPTNVVLRGRDGYRKFVEGWSTAFPDARVEIKNIFATEKGACVEFIGRGTHNGPLEGPAGAIPPTGNKLELRFCEVMQIENGKVTSMREYFDAAGMMQQLGVTPDLPAPARPSTQPQASMPH